MCVIVGQVVDDARRAGVYQSPTEIFIRHDLAGRSLHQRRTTQEDGPLTAHDDALIGHGGYVRPTGRARAEHGRDLGDAQRTHSCLVVEDPTEVLAVGEDLVLARKKCATRVDEVETRQSVRQRHLLGAQVLLHGHRVVRATLDRRVIRDDDALATAYAPNSGDDAGTGRLVVVQLIGRQRREFQEGTAAIEKRVDPVAR